jgi:PKD repeat protein
VRTGKSDKGVRELFRRKLENAELIPSTSVNSMLMRKVARKEFIRFNPGRFNVYYLSVLVAATFTAGILIFTNLGKPDYENIRTITDTSTVIPASSEIPGVPAGKIITRKNEVTQSNVSESVSVSAKQEQTTSSVKKMAVEYEKSKEADITLPSVIGTSIPKNGLFKVPLSDDKNLKGGYTTGSVLFESSEKSGCLPLKLRFINKVATFDSCKWTFGDGGLSYKSNPEWLFDVEGEYKVSLEVFGPDGLYASYSTIITVYPKPHAKFEISPENADLMDDEIVFLNYSTNGEKYKWTFGDGTGSSLFEPRHKYTRFGNYNVNLIVTSQYGCADTLVFTNAFGGSEYRIDFPNAFIPNPDGPTGGYYSSKSDEAALVFHPTYTGVSEYQLRIFSKVGQLIFESNDVNIGWDGYSRGELVNPGVYIWKVRGNFRNGEPFVKMGDVTLLRN